MPLRQDAPAPGLGDAGALRARRRRRPAGEWRLLCGTPGFPKSAGRHGIRGRTESATPQMEQACCPLPPQGAFRARFGNALPPGSPSWALGGRPLGAHCGTLRDPPGPPAGSPRAPCGPPRAPKGTTRVPCRVARPPPGIPAGTLSGIPWGAPRVPCGQGGARVSTGGFPGSGRRSRPRPATRAKESQCQYGVSCFPTAGKRRPARRKAIRRRQRPPSSPKEGPRPAPWVHRLARK
jgi:hypothetical protein